MNSKSTYLYNGYRDFQGLQDQQDQKVKEDWV